MTDNTEIKVNDRVVARNGNSAIEGVIVYLSNYYVDVDYMTDTGEIVSLRRDLWEFEIAKTRPADCAVGTILRLVDEVGPSHYVKLNANDWAWIDFNTEYGPIRPMAGDYMGFPQYEWELVFDGKSLVGGE